MTEPASYLIDDVDVPALELFLFQGSLRADELDRLFVASGRDVLNRTGLLSIDETGLARARVALFPVADRLIFSDHGRIAISELIAICSELKFDEGSALAAIASLLRRRLVCLDVAAPPQGLA